MKYYKEVKHFTVTLPKELNDEIEDYARENYFSKSQAIVTIVKTSLDQRREKDKVVATETSMN